MEHPFAAFWNACGSPFAAGLQTFPGLPGAADLQGWAERMKMLPRVQQIASAARKGATPYDVVWQSGPVSLRRYKSKVDRKHATALLCVFALVNRPYVLDLLPHKSVLRHFLDRGFDVYLVDWGIPGASDASKTLHDYIEGDLHAIVKHVLKATAQKQLSILGYCMGGTMSSMYVARHQDLVKNFILMAAPIDWSDKSSLLSAWTDAKYFDVDAVVDAVKMIPPDFLGTSFKMLRPVDNYINKYIGFYEKMTDEKFLEEFFAMETWSSDNIPISGEVYRDIVKYGFQQNLLVKGEFPLGGKKVNLGNITCPVLNLIADSDHLVPCGLSTPFKDCISSTDYTLMSVKAGHIGLAVGGRAHKELWPHAAQWLEERSLRV